MEIDASLIGWVLAGFFGASIYHLYMRSKMDSMQRHIDDALRGVYQNSDAEFDAIRMRMMEIERNMNPNKDCCKEKTYYNSNS